MNKHEPSYCKGCYLNTNSNNTGCEAFISKENVITDIKGNCIAKRTSKEEYDNLQLNIERYNRFKSAKEVFPELEWRELVKG